jgi:predicted ArsR family transcriptional regulator
MTAKQLSECLKITTMGGSQHLQLLEETRELSFVDQKANSHFEDRHEELTVQLLISVREVFGEQGLDKLINQREETILVKYQQAMLDLMTIEQRLNKLVELRSAEGYMATFEPIVNQQPEPLGNQKLVQKVEQKSERCWFLENHCPICAAATECVNFCRS